MWRNLLLAMLAAPGAAAQVPAVGAAAPEFTLEVLDGGRVSLSEFRGRPVLVNFWASWCEPCRTEMPAIIAAYEEHRATGLVVLAVNLTDQERMKDVRRFLSELPVRFPVLLDKGGSVRERYRLIAVPTTVFVDSARVVRALHPGPLSSEALRYGLARILATSPPSGTAPARAERTQSP